MRTMKIYGKHDDRTIQQLERCIAAEDGAVGVLCADGHLGYSMPIGGVVGYLGFVSPSGVGYDIACGNLAVQTNLKAADVPPVEFGRLADEIQQRISFGVGRKNNEPVDDDGWWTSTPSGRSWTSAASCFAVPERMKRHRSIGRCNRCWTRTPEPSRSCTRCSHVSS